MRKALYIFAILTLVSPAFAEGESTIDKTRTLTTASYVEQGIDVALSTYDSNTNPNGKFVETGVGPIVSAVTASNGTVTVTKSEVTIPVGSTSSSTRAVIWLE